MRTLKCPYTEIQLLVASSTMLTKINEYIEKNGEEVAINLLRSITPDADSASSVLVAQYHGITIETLVNSPNYETLKLEYGQNLLRETIMKVGKTFDLTEVESWALLLHEKLGLSV